MKQCLLFFISLLLTVAGFTQATLSFRYSNPRIIYTYNDEYSDVCQNLEWDIEFKASAAGTRYFAMQIIQSYNSLALEDFEYEPGPFGAGSINSRYNFTYNVNSGNLNLAITSNQPETSTTTARFVEIPTDWGVIGTFRIRITDPNALAELEFIQANMNGFQVEKLFESPWQRIYVNPNNYEGYGLDNLYLGRVYSDESGWSQYGGEIADVQFLDWTIAANTTIWDGNATITQADNTAALANHLNIMDDATLTIDANKWLTVNGTLINNANAAALVNKSTATGTGSLIHYSTDVEATVERYITAANWALPANGWHLLSSPIAGQTITGSSTWTPTGTGNDYDFYAFDESVTTNYEWWINQKNNPELFPTFVVGKGYLVAYQLLDTKEFTGQLNTTATSPLLTFTSGSPFEGWNLVGNPFASAIDWSTGSWVKSYVDDIPQVWHSGDATYKTMLEVSNIIPAMNGFMVHASAAGAALTIPLNARVHNATAWYKSDEEFILLKANDLQNSTSQSSIVRFNPLASNAYDPEFDSYFLAGFAPMFYSVSGNELYALNTLPEKSNALHIPFGFVKNGSSNFNIEMVKSIPDAIAYLTDYKTGTVTNLNQIPVYNFTASEGDDVNRFVLHFDFGALDVENPSAELINIYAHTGIIYISGVCARSDIKVTNLLGQVVQRAKATGSGMTTLNAKLLPKGIYVVTLLSEGHSVSRKVVL